MIARLLLIYALFLPTVAVAALGGDADSIRQDQARMSGTLRVVPAARYTVHELTLASGTVVKEFLSPAGVVFAVSWQGPFMPDLERLLGRHFASYLQGIPAGGGTSPVRVERPDLVVISTGRMRAFAGSAWVPSLLPRWVTPEGLQ